MKKLMYELTNGKARITTSDYARAKELAANGYEMRTTLQKIPETRLPLSEKRQVMITSFGRVIPLNYK